MKLGKLLAELRKEKGILQKDVAAYLEVTVATISNYEKNVHSPDYETLVKLADYFNVSTDYLLQRTDFKSSIDILNQPLTLGYTASDLLNAVIDLNQHDMESLVEYYKLLLLRNSLENSKQKTSD